MKNKTLMKTLSAFLAVVMAICSAPLSGFVGLDLPDWLDFGKIFGVEAAAATYSGTCGDNVNWSLDTSTGVLNITGTGTMYDYEYNSVPWYSYRSSVKTVNIQKGVISIGDHAFYCCDSLTSVTIPDSVTSIGSYAFACCNSLTSVTIGDSVTSIGGYAFYWCDSLTSVTISDSVEIIGSSAFEGCDSLTSIKVDSNNKNYCNDSYGVLYNKNKTTLIQYPIGNSRKTFTIPDSVTRIGSDAFYNCNSLTSVIIGDSVESIGSFAFYSCDSLTSVTIGDSVTSIGGYAFYNCDSLTSVTIPDSVTSIGSYAFGDCYSLTSVTIPDSVTSIGEVAFSYCDSLTSVIIGDGVTSIGDYAFYSCNSLTDVYYTGTEAEWNKISISSSNTSLTNATIHYNYVPSDTGGEDDTVDAEIKFGADRFSFGESISGYAGESVTGLIVYTSADYGTSSLTVTSSDPNVVSVGAINHDSGDYICEENEHRASVQLNLKTKGTATITITSPEGVSESITVTVYFDVVETVVGTFEDYVLSTVLNGSNKNWISEIVVDGVSYPVDATYSINENLISVAENYKDKTIVAVVKNDKVVWLKTVSDIKCALDCAVYLSTNSIKYQDKQYSENKIKASIYVSSANLSGFCGNITKLTAIPELQSYIYDVELSSSNADILNFNGKKNIQIDCGSLKLDFGRSALVAEIEINVDDSYKFPSEKEMETISISCVVNGKQGSKTAEDSTLSVVDIKNLDASKPTPTTPTPGIPTSNSNTQLAAKELEKAMENSAVTLEADITGTISKLFNYQQREAIGAMLLCQVAMASAPEDTFEEVLSESVIDKVFNINSNFFGVESGSVSVTEITDTKYGEVEVKFTCEYYNFSLIGEKYAFRGDIYYEIIGGKGSKKLPSEMSESGLAGTLVGADVSAFCEAAYNVAMSELNSSYNLFWGNDANKAADIIFGKSVNKILGMTKYGNVSGLVWEMLITPSKKIKIECPVNVYVYDSNGNLVAAVENDEVIKTSENASISVEGSTKNVLLFDDSYYIEYVSLAEYDMRVTVEEYGYSDAKLRTTVIEDIPLASGVNFVQNIDETILEETDYSLVSNQNNGYAPTSDVVELHDHQTSKTLEIIQVATCAQYGISTAVCDICNEWYKVITPKVDHTYVDGVCSCCNGIDPQTGNIITLIDSNGNVVDEKLINGDLTEYTFEDIADGEYTVTVSKENYVTRKYDVVSSDGKVTVEFKLNLLGDIDGNGKVNISDYNAILRHVKKTSALDGYAFDCADIDGNGKIMVTDYNAVLRHVKKTEMLW